MKGMQNHETCMQIKDLEQKAFNEKSLQNNIEGFCILVTARGLEPPSPEPESGILSIELRSHMY